MWPSPAVRCVLLGWSRVAGNVMHAPCPTLPVPACKALLDVVTTTTSTSNFNNHHHHYHALCVAQLYAYLTWSAHVCHHLQTSCSVCLLHVMMFAMLWFCCTWSGTACCGGPS